MLQLSEAQMASLSDRRVSDFEQRLCMHARQHFAQRCAQLNDQALLEATRTIISDAERRGLGTELGIALYFNVAVNMGMNFIDHAGIAWTAPITPQAGERLDPDWIRRVSDIAVATLKRSGR